MHQMRVWQNVSNASRDICKINHVKTIATYVKLESMLGVMETLIVQTATQDLMRTVLGIRIAPCAIMVRIKINQDRLNAICVPWANICPIWDTMKRNAFTVKGVNSAMN
jgi:hypothetical protein